MFCFKGCSKEVIRLQEECNRLKVDCDAQISHYVAESNIAKNKWKEAELRYAKILAELNDAKTKIDDLERKLKADYQIPETKLIYTGPEFLASHISTHSPLYTDPVKSKYPAKKKK